MRYDNRTFLILALFCFLIGGISAQNEISSPYSNYGIGMVNGCTPSALTAIGGTAYAMQDPYMINFKNPASYVAFDSLSFIADASFSIHANTLKTDSATQKSVIAHPNYLTIGLPVTKHWRTSAGILPYSDLGYVIVDNHKVEHYGNNTYTYEGDGGLMQLYWGNAFKLCKGLSLGLNISYMWGRMSYIKSVEIEGSNFFNTTINTSTHVDGIYLSAGLQYFVDIKEKHRLGFGLVYENSAYMWARQQQLITIFEGSLENITGLDTISNQQNRKGRLQMPQAIGGGLSYNYDNKLLVGADVTWRNWARYSLMGESDSLQDAITFNGGVQYTPDPMSSKYGKRISMRAGARYSTGYFSFNGNRVSEYAITVGLGFPLKGTSSTCSLNFLFEYGKLGSLHKNKLSEDFYKFTVSFTLQEKWYQRTKLE
ncbi:MAG: hypothetical protein J5862_04635 [Bacteroidales bacterium]|nr:hypothetical protein [Bacteroidales bacterium]